MLTTDLGNADAWNGRGIVLRQLGRSDEALDSFNQAIALMPDFAQALQNRGDTHWSERAASPRACCKRLAFQN